MRWRGPLPGDWANSTETELRAPVPPERWPWGPPSHHESCCVLFEGGLHCDCKASDLGEDGLDHGMGA